MKKVFLPIPPSAKVVLIEYSNIPIGAKCLFYQTLTDNDPVRAESHYKRLRLELSEPQTIYVEADVEVSVQVVEYCEWVTPDYAERIREIDRLVGLWPTPGVAELGGILKNLVKDISALTPPQGFISKPIPVSPDNTLGRLLN